MNLIEVNIEDLKEYENNPRKNDHAVEAVKKSIQEFGFKNPVIIDKNNVIVCGHTRVKASKELGIKKVPCIIADDLTEEQINAFRLVDNKTNEFASWDFDKLEEELSLISDIDMSDFGFESAEDIDLDGFFSDSDTNGSKEEKKKTIICPHCGEEIEI